MIDLGIALIFISIFSILIKRSFLNFIWSLRFFFTGFGLVLVEASKQQYEIVAVSLYIISILLVFNLLSYLNKGRELIEDIDTL